LVEIATKRFGERATFNKNVDFRINENSSSNMKNHTRSFFNDSFGIWNFSNNVFMQNGADKKFLGTICIVKKN
jgi:hypothetical protein